MKLTNRIALAALAGFTALGGLAATPASARDSLTIEYRDGNYRGGDYRDYDRYRDRRDYREHRDWRAYDRGYYRGRGYDRCWTEWQWDGWRHERVPVRVCR
jgi:hypothetical protein